MKTLKHKVAGVVLFVGAVLVAVTIQLLGSGLVTTRSLPVPPPAAGPGITNPSSITETIYHWPLVALAIIAVAGLVCFILPRHHHHAA